MWINATNSGGANYAIVFKVDFASYKFVYFIKNESDVASVIIEFHQSVERQTSNKIRIFKSEIIVQNMLMSICLITLKRALSMKLAAFIVRTEWQGGKRNYIYFGKCMYNAHFIWPAKNILDRSC